MVKIRSAETEDAGRLLEIYRYYVVNTAITFECGVPSPEMFSARIGNTLKLTKDSEEFHRHLGFVKVGEFHKCGCKFGRWYNMIWMEKIIS